MNLFTPVKTLKFAEYKRPEGAIQLINLIDCNLNVANSSIHSVPFWLHNKLKNSDEKKIYEKVLLLKNFIKVAKIYS